MDLFLQALIPLALEGTDMGQTKAAQALAKLTITSNPEMTFPGERVSAILPWACPLPCPLLGSSLGPTARGGFAELGWGGGSHRAALRVASCLCDCASCWGLWQVALTGGVCITDL